MSSPSSPDTDSLLAARLGRAALALLAGVDLADPTAGPATPGRSAARLEAAVAAADLDQLARCQEPLLLLPAVALATEAPRLDEQEEQSVARVLAPVAAALARHARPRCPPRDGLPVAEAAGGTELASTS